MAAKKPYYRNLFEELEITRESVIQFSFGAPSLTILTKLKPLLCEATKRCLEDEDTSGVKLQYGALRGDPIFIEELSKFLSKHYNEPVCSDDIVCTSGATQGAFLLASLFLKSGDYVFVEDTTYFINLKVFQNDLKLNIVTVPMDKDGVNVDAFDEMLTEYREKLGPTHDKRPYRGIFYNIPVFHNPTGRSLPKEKCAALIKVLRKHDILALCDDVYNIIHFGNGPPPQRLFSYDKKTDSDYKGHVVSNGSFSKILGPGLRLGWLEAPEVVVNRVVRSSVIMSGGGLNQYTSAIIGTALKYGIFSGYIEDLLGIYKTKMEAMCEALDKHMKSFIKYTKPKGGYYIWFELLVDCDVNAFQRYCVMNHHVDFRPGPCFLVGNIKLYYLHEERDNKVFYTVCIRKEVYTWKVVCFSFDGGFKNCIRLSFAYIELDEIDKGIQELSEALQNFLKQ